MKVKKVKFDEQVIKIIACSGSKGEKGEKGDKGDTGEQGVQGIQGVQGPQGEAFNIYKTYSTIAEMNADKVNVEEGKFVMIVSNVEDPDNAKLYVKGSTDFVFLTDMSGATGIQGPRGEQGIQGIQGERGERGERGEKGDTGEVSLVNAENMLNMGAKTISTNGNSYQKTTTGKNLWGGFTLTKTNFGITFTYNTDGTITANGTSTGNALSMTSGDATNYLTTLSAGTYTINGGTSNVYLQVCNSAGGILANTNGNSSVSFTLSEDTNIFVRARIGENITVNNVTLYQMLETGSTASDYEPYTEKIATPNPDYPQEIETITDIKIVGKNLFGFGITAIDKTSTYRPNSSQRLTLTAGNNVNEVKFNYGSGSYCTGYFELENIDGTLDYTISFNVKENTTQFTPAVLIDTTNSTIDKLVVIVSGANGSTRVTTSDYFILNNIQLEKGLETTPYKEFKGVTIPLSTNELAKIGDISDKLNIDLDTGAVSKISNIEKVVLDGSGSFTYNSGINSIRYNGINDNLINNAIITTISNYFVGCSFDDRGILTIPRCYFESRYLQFRGGEWTSSDSFKTWLSTHNTIVYYVLETPITSQISTLSQSDIDIIKSIPANELNIIANLDTTLSSTTYLDTLIEYLRTIFVEE